MLRDFETLLADAVSNNNRWQRIDFLGEGVLVFVFGPGLTALLIKTKTSSFPTLCCSAAALQPVRAGGALRDAAVSPARGGYGEADEQLVAQLTRTLGAEATHEQHNAVSGRRPGTAMHGNRELGEGLLQAHGVASDDDAGAPAERL
jgi:hypothetical protein